MASVIMLSGPIGAGKTAVARELASRWQGPLSAIEGDVFWSFIAKSKSSAKSESSDRRENFRIISRAMTAASVPFVRSGYDVLLDFSIPPEFLKTARVILKDVSLDYVVLRPSLAVCEARAAGRAKGRIADYGPYRSFYALFDGAEPHMIREDDADAVTIAEHVRDGLAAGLFRVS